MKFACKLLIGQYVGKVPDVYDLSKYRRFSDTTEKKIHAYFKSKYKSGIFNGTYLLYSHDSLIQGALGYANFTRWDTLLNNDYFQLASVSKTITGTAILCLQQDGYLKVEDSVHWYIPNLERRNLTIQHLLTHTSGLPDYFYFSAAYWPWSYKHMSNADVVEQVNKQPWGSFASPGMYHSYSNTNYVLLARIVENLSGMDFKEYARKRIFEPAGMKGTHVADFDSIPLNQYIVHGCEYKRVLPDNQWNGATGDKGIYSNGMDLFLLDRFLRNNFLLHDEAKSSLYNPRVVAGDGVWYALGWRIKYKNGYRWAFHNGFWKGFRTYYFRCLDDDKCFVVLTNNVYGPFLSTAEIMELLETEEY